MFNSFSAAVSAMKAHALAVDTVGNNLANVNTTGFKASGVAFKDLVSESMSARSESGMGVGQAMTVRSFAQGAASIFDSDEPIGRPTDSFPKGNRR